MWPTHCIWFPCVGWCKLYASKVLGWGSLDVWHDIRGSTFEFGSSAVVSAISLWGLFSVHQKEARVRLDVLPRVGFASSAGKASSSAATYSAFSLKLLWSIPRISRNLASWWIVSLFGSEDMRMVKTQLRTVRLDFSFAEPTLFAAFSHFVGLLQTPHTSYFTSTFHISPDSRFWGHNGHHRVIYVDDEVPELLPSTIFKFTSPPSNPS